MENERREQDAPATPMLDSLIAKLPPPHFDQRIEMRLTVVAQAREHLLKKIEDDTLTQMDIETALRNLPNNVDGIEEGKMQLVQFVQMNIPDYDYDIKKLPVA